MPVNDFNPYLMAETDFLLERLGQVVTDIANMYEEIGMIQATEIREKAHALQSSQESSSSGRRDRVSMTVVEPPATLAELGGQLSALIEEKWYIVRILDSRSANGNA